MQLKWWREVLQRTAKTAHTFYDVAVTLSLNLDDETWAKSGLME